MKIEIDIKPEEVRERFGLPDTTEVQKLFVDRVTDWAKQHHNDTESVQKWMEAMFQGGRQSFEAYQDFLKNLTQPGQK